MLFKKERNVICIITALKVEAAPVVSRLINTRRKRSDEFTFWQGETDTKRLIVLSGACDIDRAIRGVMYCIQKFNPCLILKWGAAGAVAPDLNMNDVVIPRAIYYCPYRTADEIEREKFPDDLAGELLKVPPIYHGTGITPSIKHVEKSIQTHFPLRYPLLRDHLYKCYNISTVDMESHAVMKTATGSGIECGVVQVITDNADERAIEDFKKCVKDTMEIAAPLLLEIIHAFNR